MGSQALIRAKVDWDKPRRPVTPCKQASFPFTPLILVGFVGEQLPAQVHLENHTLNTKKTQQFYTLLFLKNDPGD